jgi:uncharacterized membrane protein YhaH (DUF805 family)
VRGTLWIIGSVIGYFTGGHFIVSLGQWLILFCGRIAEIAMLASVLFLTANFVAHDFFSTRLGPDVIATGISLAILALSLLPEITLYSAVIVTISHWQDAFADRQALKHWAWAVIYSVPTLSFFGMTVYTISSMVSEGGHFQQATGVALVLRCLAGWLYGLIELIHAGMSKRRNRQGVLPTANTALLETLQSAMEVSNQQMLQQISDLAQQVSLLSQQTQANNQQITLLAQQTANAQQQISKEQQSTQQISKDHAANVAEIQQNQERSQASMEHLADIISKVKEELSAPREAFSKGQQRLFALPARPAKSSKESFAESKEQQSDTGDLLAVDLDVMATVRTLMALEGLADLEQSDVYKVVEASLRGISKSQIYLSLGWGSSKHTRIVRPVINALMDLGKAEQAM